MPTETQAPKRPAPLPGMPDTPVTDDIIEDVLRVCMAMAPGFSEAVARSVDSTVRDRWAGSRAYISRRPGEGRSDRNEAIRRDYLAGERFGLLERRYQLSRRQIIRIVKT